MSLYASLKQSFLGLICHIIVSCISYGETGDITFLVGMAVVIAIFAGRAWDFQKYRAAFTPETENDFAFSRRWEFRYMVGVTAIALWIGAFGAYSVVFHGFQVPNYLQSASLLAR